MQDYSGFQFQSSPDMPSGAARAHKGICATHLTSRRVAARGRTIGGANVVVVSFRFRVEVALQGFRTALKPEASLLRPSPS